MEKKRRIIVHLLVGAFSMFLLFACKPDEPEQSERVVLAYLIGDNNLDRALRNNITDMEEGMKGVNGKLLIYHDGLNETPKLYLIDSNGKRTFLQELPEENSSCSSERMKEIINYLFREYPARSYGMILSSHGYGWIPLQTATKQNKSSNLQNVLNFPFEDERTNPLTRYFGEDILPYPTQKFEIKTLTSCFPQDKRFDFLFFDACFMASIESLYEMRNCSHYTIASQAEVLAYGAPFQKICKYLFMDNAQLPALCDEYMNFYQSSNLIDGEPSASISVVNNNQLENLAQSARSLMEEVTTAEITTVASQVQVCERVRTTTFFDLGHFYSLLCPQKYIAFQAALSQAIIAERHTPKIYSDLGFKGKFSAKNFTGINCFIPLTDKNVGYNLFYYQTEWAQTVKMPK